MATKTNTEINGRKYFRITRTIGHEIIDGKKKAIKKQFYGSSKAKAEQAYEDWKEAQRSEAQTLTETVKTFGAMLSYYEENVFEQSTEFANSSKKLYLRSTNALRRDDRTGLFTRAIKNVTAADIQLAYNNWETTKSTIEAVHKHLKSFYKWVVRNNYAADPMNAVVIPKKSYTKRKEDVIIWDDDEIHLIFSSLNDHRLRLFIYIAYFTGMRIGEILGLKYSDIYNGAIHIRRQNHDMELIAPKYNSVRDIPINDVLADEIERHRQWHTEEAEKHHYKLNLVFTSSSGRMMHPKNVYQALSRFYKANGIPHKSPHTYRATFCTNLCKAGVPLQIASNLMGHKSINVTNKYYTFISDTEKASAIAKLKIF